jgi:serine/threonine protein kinase
VNQNREELLFQLALTKPASERASWLDRECGDDRALRARLEALLSAHEQPDSALGTEVEAAPVAKQTMKLDLADAPDEAVGQKIGRYKILERVGEGGCGVVYVAEQTEPVRRRVALKVIKLGMDTKQVVARFEAERQALAMMDHPNIAKVLDAGTTDVGRPFFVMELVRGIRITDYCDQTQLSTKDRLDLFIKVCQAIQHAHQKGIIHRDIKPSNILVTLHDGVPVPKVIDFGIAKATEGRLTDATVYTQLHQFIGTPAYMSPEQAEMSGLDIDTRSDIYSLGVLLYELLAGSTPFDGHELMSHGIDAMRKTIREQEPQRPSTRFATLKGEQLTTTARRRSADKAKLIHQLQGDLDWIVMKCLEKDRTRRYETANGLATDLKRHLNNEPVAARPPSTAYRIQKAIRRNKISFAAGTIVFGALFLGIIATTWQSVRATRAKAQADVEKQRANREAATANRVTGFLQKMLATANPDSSKSADYTVRAMLDDFAAAIDTQFPDNPDVAAGLHTTIGKAFWNMQQGNKAKIQMARALELRAAAAGTKSANYADSLVDYAETPSINASAAEMEECEAYLNKALAIYHERGIKGQRVIHALWALQMIFDKEGKRNQIEALVTEAKAEASQSPGTNYWELAAMNTGLVNAKADEGKYAESVTIARETIAENDRLFGPDYIQTAWTYYALTYALLPQSKYPEALESAQQAFAIMRKRISPDQEWYGRYLIALFDPLIAARSARAMTNLFSSADQLEKLESLFQERLGTKPLLPDDGSDPVNVAKRAVPQFPALYLELASELTAAGSTNQAAECRRKANALIEQLQTQSRTNAGVLDTLHGSLTEEVKTLLDAGKYAEAELVARECVTLCKKLIPDDWRNFNAQSLLGGSLLGQKKYVDAEPLLLAGYEGLKLRAEKIPAAGKYNLPEAFQRLVQLYEETNRSEMAAKLKKELESSNPTALK